jgi:hypothetical protein
MFFVDNQFTTKVYFIEENRPKPKRHFSQIWSFFQLSAISFHLEKNEIKRMPLLSGLGFYNYIYDMDFINDISFIAYLLGIYSFVKTML